MNQGDPRVREVIASIAGAYADRLDDLTGAVTETIEAALPDLAEIDQGGELLWASVNENVRTIVQLLQQGGAVDAVVAPEAAVTYARRLAQWDIPSTRLIHAYRTGQNRFFQEFVSELLQRSPGGEHIEGLVCLEAFTTMSGYIDRVLDQVLTTYATARDGWMQDRSAVLAIRVREILDGTEVDVASTERALDYRLDESRHHVGAIFWVNDASCVNGLEIMRAVVQSVQVAQSLPPALFVPDDEATAWVWFPTDKSLAGSDALQQALAAHRSVAVSLGEPAVGLEGLRRSHQQAASARSVAVVAGQNGPAMTPFTEVAPITMLSADMDAARAWIRETLGGLADDTSRNAGLRETALVFLQTGGSYTAAADQLYLHRNTAQYRIRKAEEERGRPLREGRLDVEIALLACQWMGDAVLRPVVDD